MARRRAAEAKAKRVAAWKGVNSSCLRAIKKDSATRTLEVEFKASAARYRYHDVSPQQQTGLERAASIGRTFVKKVRNAGYEYERLRGPQRSKSTKRRR
jgi:hypothetical protein